MLVRSGMEDDAPTVHGEKFVHQCGVTGAAKDKRHGFGCTRGSLKIIRQCSLELVKIVLCRFKQKQCWQAETDQTHGECGANGATGARNKNRHVENCV